MLRRAEKGNFLGVTLNQHLLLLAPLKMAAGWSGMPPVRLGCLYFYLISDKAVSLLFSATPSVRRLEQEESGKKHL